MRRERHNAPQAVTVATEAPVGLEPVDGGVRRREPEGNRTIRAAFIMEMGLGHTTFFTSLQEIVAETPDIEPTWIPITFTGGWPLGWLPKVRHDVVLRAALQAWSKLRRAVQEQRFEVLFFHTQMPSIFSAGFMRRTPTVVSIDATPSQFERMGWHYGLRETNWGALSRSFRERGYRAAFQNAAHVVGFSEWAVRGAVAEYGVSRDAASVIRPGVNLRYWQPAPKPSEGPIRLLFVGGDFERKGGDLLLRWMSESEPDSCVLDVVTQAELSRVSGVSVHRGFTPNDPRLIDLYRRAHLLVLPTRADISPWVVMEAMAAGTAVLSTRVGAVPEYVGVKGEAGVTIEPDSYDALRSTLRALLDDRCRLEAMGVRARARAELLFDGERNLRNELQLLRTIAANRDSQRRG